MRASKPLYLMTFLVFVSLVVACTVTGDGISPGEGLGGDGNEQEGSEGGFGTIIFCEQVTEDGKIIGASNTFSNGTNEVWAYFNYWGMKKGQLWGRIWTHNSQEYITAVDEMWEDLDEGWVAYSIGGSYDLEPGEYELTLMIGDRLVKRSTFRITDE